MKLWREFNRRQIPIPRPDVGVYAGRPETGIPHAFVVGLSFGVAGMDPIASIQLTAHTLDDDLVAFIPDWLWRG